MKTTIPYILAALAASGLAFGVETAYTTPVGYYTASFSGNPSGNDAGAETFVSANLVNPTVFAGAATSSPSGGKVISFSGGVPTDLDGTYILEIADGTSEGWWSSVDVSTSTSITIVDDFPAGLSASVKVSVRKFSTIQNLLGNNAPGLVSGDEVQTLDPSSQAGTTIVWDGAQWVNFVTENPAGTDIVYPGTAVKIIRRATAGGSFTVTGSVKTTKTQVDIFPGDNWLGQVNPTGGTLGSMSFAPQILGTDFLDLIRYDTGEGQSGDTYVKSGADMVNFVTENVANDEPISAGYGYYIRRETGGGSTITIPAQVISN